jgi:hypothetical protein
MNLPVDSDNLGSAFRYLTSLGVAPKFGSVPIGYYQQIQCAALRILETTQATKVRVRKQTRERGYAPERPWNRDVELFERGAWRKFCRVDELSAAASDSIR